MTIIRTARPRTSMDTGFAAGVDALRVSLDAAERAMGASRPGMSLRRGSGWGSIELDLTMRDHPEEWRLLELTFSLDQTSETLVERWSAADPTAEAIAFARGTLDDVVAERVPADDDRDEVAIGLAWLLIGDHDVDAVIIERRTPWSGPRILTGRHVPDQSPGRPVQFHWTHRDPRSAAERAALDGMRSGTLVEPHGQDARFKPLSRIIRADDPGDPMARLRALGAWAEFERGRP